MKNDDNILPQFGRRDGMTVPDGYFDEFGRRMSASLPFRPELESPQQDIKPRTWWQKSRPYVYMAAMFAGIWCMLKVFTLMTSSPMQPIDANPILAEAFSNDTFVNECVISDISQWDLYDDIMDDGISPEALLDSAVFVDSLKLFR